ncbi:MAG: histidine kinase, partial [Bacteroidota bacterium]|nr:histidine kinase [Bacteroidota bacterium]
NKIGQKNIIPFGKLEGFSGVECNTGGYADDDGAIWFGTVNGLIKYDPKEYIPNRSESKTSITGFRLFYSDTLLTNNIHLEHYNNNITFNYSGICLTNPAKVRYSYILEGSDKAWSPPTMERLATYSNLQPGTYTFKLISSNNEGVWNKVPTTFSFTINRPFWKTWWFITFSTLAVMILFILSIRYRIRQIKNKEKRKTEMNKKIAQIESQALRAQMNPHFIFNTLSSIQHYISNNNTDSALKYLSKFAKLMRRIMDNSKQQMIPVAEEIGALELYLELEVMRFDNKFHYEIKVDSSIDKNYDRIPSMLIQPYVENAIIHGLLPKSGSGKIAISLHRQDETILCTIEDNGIGREKSKEFKKHRIQQHKSMGMSITQERLDILNSSLKSNLNAEIIDLFEDGQPSGTKVRLIIPLESGENE